MRILILLPCLAQVVLGQAAFEHRRIDANGPLDLWLKSVGDLNGDKKPDLIAGGWRGGGLVWYENPSWRKHVIASQAGFSTDGEASDVDGDGDMDFVAVTAKQIVWFENPSWKMRVVDDRVVHDVEVADLNRDGRPDIVARNQGAFKGNSGSTLFFFFQDGRGGWKQQTVTIPNGEGLLAADLDRDKDTDIVIGGVWLENPSWTQHRFGGKWDYPHVFLATGDFNGDKRPDIAMSPSELAGGTYRISWFAAPRNPKDPGAWVEHVLAEAVETVHHFIGAGDFDGDRQTDIVTAAMLQGKEKAITLFRNMGKGRRWIPQLVAPVSSHSMRVVDVDGDGKPDLFGADWRGSRSVELWLNMTRRGR